MGLRPTAMAPLSCRPPTLRYGQNPNWALHDGDTIRGINGMRKIAVIGAALLAIFIQGLIPGATHAADRLPADQIKDFDDALLASMKAGKAAGMSGRSAILAPVIDRVFDMPEMTRLSLGSSAKTLSDDQTKALEAAFRQYTIASYAGNFDEFGGDRFQIDAARPGENGRMVVHTSLIPGDGTVPVMLDYVMREVGGQWRVIDILAEGAVSQMAARRAEFVTILRRDGFDGLMAAIAKKTQAAATKP